MTLAGKEDQFPNRVQNTLAESACHQGIFSGHEIPDFHDVLRGARVQTVTLVTRHFLERSFSRSASRWRRPSRKVSPSSILTRPLFMSS